MRRLADTLRREVRAAGPGEWLAAALLVSAFYLDPIAGNAPWSAALVVTCLAGAVLIVRRPENIRRIPLIMVAFVAAYALTAVLADFGGGSDVARYIVRPVALASLTLFLTTPDSRRRVMQLLTILLLPQVIFTAIQTIEARIDFGVDAGRAADSVTGTFGDYGGGPMGLVAVAVLCIVGGLVLTNQIDRRLAAGIAVVIVAIEVFTATRAAVVFLPAAAAAFAAGAVVVLRKRTPVKPLAAILAVAALSVPLIYAGTQLVYPGAFTGAFSNQTSGFLGNGVPSEGGKPPPLTDKQGNYRGPVGVAVLPGRFQQIKDAAKLSKESGVKTLLVGRGYGVSAVNNEATVFTYIPPEGRVGVTWIGKILTETGWLGLIAFLALLGWLAWLGVKILRAGATGYDRALGFALPGFAAVTLTGAMYTTVLDVRPYSAAFIVLAAAGFAAARDADSADASPGPAGGNGRRARPSTPLPPRQTATSSAPSAESARSN